MRTANLPKRLVLVGILSLGLVGCNPSGGGGPGSGGTTTSTGGAGAGGTTGSGGTVASGGSMGSGGSQGTGGASTGTGGAGTGGASTGKGGAGTGGASTGAGGTRSGTGGGSGGSPETGGSSTRPDATGGRVGTGGRTTGAGGSGSGGNNTSTGGGNTGRGGGTTGGMGGGSTGGQTAGGTTGAGGDPVKSAGCGKTPSLKTGKALSISVSGTDRTYNLSVPDNYDNSHPYRLIMSYHWMNGTANNVTDGSMAKPYYGLWDLAAGSTIFVAPQGTSNMWSNSGGVDVEFSRQLITLIESEFCIDTSRIFCEGFSMGGSMSYAMACAMGDVVRGVAVHSGGSMSGCVKPHDKPVAYFMTHGTEDTMCDYKTFGLPILADFAKVNGCTTTTDALPVPTSTAGACLDFEGCKAGYPVRACSFVGPHTPSPDGTSGWVPKESWKFISQF